KISSTYLRNRVLSTALEKSIPKFGPSGRYSPGGPGGGGEAPPGGSAKRRMSGAERQGGDLLTPWKYSARQRISSTYLRRAVPSPPRRAVKGFERAWRASEDDLPPAEEVVEVEKAHQAAQGIHDRER